MTDVLHIDVRFLVQLALCSALLTGIAQVAFRRNAVTRRAYALLAGGLLVALPFVLTVSSDWYWTAPFEPVAILSLAGTIPIPVWLVGVWAVLAVWLNGKALVHVLRSCRSLARLGAVADETIVREAAAVAQGVGFARPYRLHFGLDACSSSLAGDRIVLPTEAKNWRLGTLRAVLAHEFVHLSRRDDLGVLALRLVLHWYWFAPWVGLLHRQYVRAMEQSCDDRAAECLPSCADYLDGVLCAVREESQLPTVVSGLGGSEAVVRFQRFLGIREHQLDVGGVYWGLLTVLGAALLLTSVEFEAGEAVADWGAPVDARRVFLNPPALTMPEVRERVVGGDDSPPRRAPQPIYPGHALNDAIEGFVVVEYRLAGDGRVVRPSVVASEPVGVFDDAVLRAVASREYGRRPRAVLAALPGDIPPPRRMVRRFDFRLPNLPNSPEVEDHQ